jgi:hypothetical protein
VQGAVQVRPLGDSVGAMPPTPLGRACVLAEHIRDETTRAQPDWQQIAADAAELTHPAGAAQRHSAIRARMGFHEQPCAVLIVR